MTETLTVLRKQLREFAEQCELKLKRNDHKSDWRDLPVEALVRKLEIELEEMKVAIQYEGPKEAMNECVDVANFAMMLWDRLRQPTAFFEMGSPPKPTTLREITEGGEPMGLVGNETLPIGPAPERVAAIWTRHGTWMDGNRAIAKMYRQDFGDHQYKIFYEDVPAVRERKLNVVSEHIARHLEHAAQYVAAQYV